MQMTVTEDPLYEAHKRDQSLICDFWNFWQNCCTPLKSKKSVGLWGHRFLKRGQMFSSASCSPKTSLFSENILLWMPSPAAPHRLGLLWCSPKYWLWFPKSGKVMNCFYTYSSPKSKTKNVSFWEFLAVRSNLLLWNTWQMQAQVIIIILFISYLSTS